MFPESSTVSAWTESCPTSVCLPPISLGCGHRDQWNRGRRVLLLRSSCAVCSSRSCWFSMSHWVIGIAWLSDEGGLWEWCCWNSQVSSRVQMPRVRTDSAVHMVRVLPYFWLGHSCATCPAAVAEQSCCVFVLVLAAPQHLPSFPQVLASLQVLCWPTRNLTTASSALGLVVAAVMHLMWVTDRLHWGLCLTYSCDCFNSSAVTGRWQQQSCPCPFLTQIMLGHYLLVDFNHAIIWKAEKTVLDKFWCVEFQVQVFWSRYLCHKTLHSFWKSVSKADTGGYRNSFSVISSGGLLSAKVTCISCLLLRDLLTCFSPYVCEVLPFLDS